MPKPTILVVYEMLGGEANGALIFSLMLKKALQQQGYHVPFLTARYPSYPLEAEEVFDNKPFLASEDIKHSQEERRFQALGQTNQERRLFISFTVRKNKIRIISARNMSKKEEVKYEKV